MRVFGWTLLVCTMALWLCTTGPANAGTITVQQYRDVGGGRIVVPISNTLESGDAPSTLQFDLHYPPQQIKPVDVVAGIAVEAAGKGVSYNVVQPGVIRVIAAGLNRSPITDGLIAELTFEPTETAAGGEVALTLRNTVMADADANLIVSHGVDGSIEIDVGREETSGPERGLEPIASQAGGDASVVEPAETMPARVVIPGVVDTVIARPTARATPAPAQPSADGTATAVPAATEPAGRRTTVAGTPDGAPEEPAARPALGTENAGSPTPFPSPAQDVRSRPAPQRTDEIAELEPDEVVDLDMTEPDTAAPATSSRRWGIVAIEAGAVIVALVLFLGARKLFRV